MPEVTSRSPKQNRSSTSSSTQRSLAPCWASYCPSLALRSDPSTFADLHLLATFHPRISVHSLSFEAFCSRTIAGSSHNIEEKKNWDTPSLASSSLTQKAAVPQFLSCCDSHPKAGWPMLQPANQQHLTHNRDGEKTKRSLFNPGEWVLRRTARLKQHTHGAARAAACMLEITAFLPRVGNEMGSETDKQN